MKRTHKLKSRAGFTLAETLLAVLILLLVSGIVATGVPVAKNVYEKTVVAANAQVLLSTTITALKDELGTAWDVAKDDTDAGKITYFSADTGALATIDITETGIMIQDYAIVAGMNTAAEANGEVRRLISAKAATSDLFVTIPDLGEDSISTEDGVVTIKNLTVCRGSTENIMAKLDTLQIRPVNIKTA